MQATNPVQVQAKAGVRSQGSLPEAQTYLPVDRILVKSTELYGEGRTAGMILIWRKRTEGGYEDEKTLHQQPVPQAL